MFSSNSLRPTERRKPVIDPLIGLRKCTVSASQDECGVGYNALQYISAGAKPSTNQALHRLCAQIMSLLQTFLSFSHHDSKRKDEKKKGKLIQSGMRSDALGPKAPPHGLRNLLIAEMLAPTGLDAVASEIFWSLAVCCTLRRLENCVIVNTADMKSAFALGASISVSRKWWTLIWSLLGPGSCSSASCWVCCFHFPLCFFRRCLYT